MEPIGEVGEGEGIPVAQDDHEGARALGITARGMGGEQPATGRYVDPEVRPSPRVDARQPRQEFVRCKCARDRQRQGGEVEYASLASG